MHWNWVVDAAILSKFSQISLRQKGVRQRQIGFTSVFRYTAVQPKPEFDFVSFTNSEKIISRF